MKLQVMDFEAKRTCGECSLCCKLLMIDAVPSLPNCWCKHIDHDGKHGSCGIYIERPDECAEFRCLWLDGLGDVQDRPDRSGVVFVWREDGATIEETGETLPSVCVHENHHGLALMHGSRPRALVTWLLRTGHCVVAVFSGSTCKPIELDDSGQPYAVDILPVDEDGVCRALDGTVGKGVRP